MKPKVLIIIFSLVALAVAAFFVGDRYRRRTEEIEPESGNQLPNIADKALRSDGGLVLYSLDPYPSNPNAVAGAKLFHGYPVLGETVVGSSDSRQALAETLKRATVAWEGGYAMCFIPRHGLRASHGGSTFEFVICFECGRIHLYQGEGEPSSHEMNGKAGPFDELLAAAKIPKAP